MFVDKHYPVQGSNKFQTVSFPITKAFAYDFGAQTSGTNDTFAIASFPSGAQVLSFTVKIIEALETGGAGTVTFGFTGTPMLTTAIASGAATIGAVFGPMYAMGVSSQVSSLTAVSAYTPIVLKAEDTFDCAVGTTAPGATTGGAGKADIYVTYVPVPNGTLSTSEFLSVVST